MKDVARYLLENHYSKWAKDEMPSEEVLIKQLDIHKDRLVVVHREGKVAGVAVFLTLSNDTFERMHMINMLEPGVLDELLEETGDNLHFIIISAEGLGIMLEGYRKIKNRLKPRSMSWYDNDGRLHKHGMN